MDGVLERGGDEEEEEEEEEEGTRRGGLPSPPFLPLLLLCCGLPGLLYLLPFPFVFIIPVPPPVRPVRPVLASAPTTARQLERTQHTQFSLLFLSPHLLCPLPVHTCDVYYR